ncbi:hypothetical protein EN829_027895 [Mesorhizobium sp. M00.F.Ca.ET.186.01.1.1]|nr:hypothetical protein EN848_27070 [bacterium M00.F.Ca.ET.205.01.1.1]TGU48092.1 hypothetical protein EN795_28350 [bacterium M00.F.Ca.ET.152.01.1.1]TGV32332.1 hypothetical protein EN829_027895 [Mesorhizobium sp. M00.F.Ca.ET.186.01.1.1]TGZ39543.1 hypothetical protein EN805_27745 [bacterium M00.F.Ca.ET.162.01.1.1]
MRKPALLLLAASLCGCVSATPPPDAGNQRVNPIPISLALEEIITTGIRQRLQDPASAKFGTMLAGERTLNGRQEIVVCGHVTTRSSGGNGTDKPFAAKIYPDAGSSFELVAIGDEPPNTRLVGETCRAVGLPIL